MHSSDPYAQYWSEYSNLQRVKHDLIKQYLDGWLPKMTLGPTGFKRLLYIDTHAGRGKHLTGELGSPLVALSTLLNHKAREAILSKARLHYLFIERDTENVAALQLELASIENPHQVTVEAVSGDFSDIIEKAFVSSVSAPQPTPAFIFVDPFGFKLPGGLLRNLLSYPKVELFVNIMWRELDLAICNVRKEQAPAPTRRSYSLGFDT